MSLEFVNISCIFKPVDFEVKALKLLTPEVATLLCIFIAK